MPDDNKPKEEEVVIDDPAQTPPAPEPPVETPPVEPEEPEESPVEEEEEPEETPPPVPPAEPSRRETLRIQDLLSKYGPPPQAKPAPTTRPDALDYSTSFNVDPAVAKQLEEDRRAEGETQFNAGLEQAKLMTQTSEWRTLLQVEAPRTEEKYNWLNPSDKENFVPALADAVNQEYMHLSGYNPETGVVLNPGLSYSKFVDARVELSTRLAKAMTAKTAENITKQAANTGLRPDGGTAKKLNLNKAPQDMSLEELYASIGQKPPGK